MWSPRSRVVSDDKEAEGGEGGEGSEGGDEAGGADQMELGASEE